MPTPPARPRRRPSLPEWAFLPLGCLALLLLWGLASVLVPAVLNRTASIPPPDPAVLAHRLGLQRAALRVEGYVVAAWLLLLALLFLAGTQLSRLTLAAIRRAEFAPPVVTPGDRRIRSLYSAIVAASCLYFYASIPIAMLVVVTLPLFVAWTLAIRANDLLLGALLTVPSILILVALVRSARPRHAFQRRVLRPLPRDEAPLLWALVDEVAARMGTRPADAVELSPSTDISAREEGTLAEKLAGTGKRYLTIGLGVLPGLSVGQLQFIVAHECAHFLHGDTVGGPLEGHVLTLIHRVATDLWSRGWASRYNPAWLFIAGYDRLLAVIYLGASRHREVMADRLAAAAYGARNSASSLAHLVRRDCTVGLCLDSGYVMHIYGDGPLEESLRPQLEANVEYELALPTLPWNSHPSMRDRLRYLRLLDRPGEPGADPRPVWDLLPNVEELRQYALGMAQQEAERRRAYREYVKQRQRYSGRRR